MLTGYRTHFAASGQTPAQAQVLTTIEQFTSYMQHAIAAAQPSPKQRSTSKPHSRAPSSQQHSSPKPGPSSESQAAESDYRLQRLLQPVVLLLRELAGSASKAQQSRGALHVLQLAHSVVEAMQQQGGQASAADVEPLLSSKEPIAQLRYAVVQNTQTTWNIATMQLQSICLRKHDLPCVS